MSTDAAVQKYIKCFDQGQIPTLNYFISLDPFYIKLLYEMSQDSLDIPYVKHVYNYMFQKQIIIVC